MPRIIGSLLCCLVALSLLFGGPLTVAASSARTPSETDDLGRYKSWSFLIFLSNRNGNYEIYRARTDGSEQTRITYTTGNETNPAINRTGTKIAYVLRTAGNTDIYRINIDGSEITRLTTHKGKDFSPVWSPDGARVAFVSDRDGDAEIFVMNADGSQQTQLTFNDYTDISPTWGPNGTLLAWIQQDEALRSSIWKMNSDGSGQALNGYFPYWVITRLSWSPSGYLAYECDPDLNGYIDIIHGRADTPNGMYLVNTGTAGDARIGDWSPDGAYMIYTFENRTTGQYILKIADPNKAVGAEDVVLPGSGADFQPRWPTADLLPPVTHVLPLPQYSLASDYLVHIQGSDQGPAGIERYELQYRTDSTWYTWEMSKEKIARAWGDPGQTHYWRSRAKDNAGNWSEWSGGENGETRTFLCDTLLNGRVTDNRGFPIGDLEIGFNPSAYSPVTTSPNGDYFGCLSGAGAQTLLVSHTGHDIPFTNFTAEGLGQFDFYLAPTGNLLLNSVFETGLDHWTVSGSMAAAQTMAQVHSDTYALRLGQNCPEPCLPPQTLAWNGENSSLAAGPDGSLHMIWFNPNSSEIDYSVRSPEGTWSDPVKIGQTGTSTSGVKPVLRIDHAGTLHAAWNSDAGAFYTQKPPAGSWRAQERALYEFGELDMDVDKAGNVHIIVSSIWMKYVWRQSGLGWHPAVNVETSANGINRPAIAAGPDGTIHFVYDIEWFGPQFPFWRARLPNGTFTEQRMLVPPLQYHTTSSLPKQIAIDAQGGVLVLFSGGSYAYTVYRQPDGVWEPSQAINDSDSGGYMQARQAPDGTLYVAVRPTRSNALFMKKRTPDGQWLPRQMILDSTPVDISLAVDPSGDVHIAWPGAPMGYATRGIAETTGDSIASQTITIPADAQNPTLAGMLRGANVLPGAASVFTVSVTTPTETVNLLTVHPKTAWKHWFADLSPWAGQTITLNLGLNQAAGETYMQAYLDTLTLSAWLTPAVETITPNSLKTVWEGILLTLTGYNFTSGSTVSIGGHPAGGFNFIDPNTIEITIPAGVPAGMHTLRVENQDGLTGTSFTTLNLGQLLYLPLMIR